MILNENTILSDKNCDEIISLFKKGVIDPEEISNTTGIPKEYVERYFLISKLNVNKKAITNYKIAKKYSEGLSLYEIADALKIPTHKVRKWFNEYNIEINTKKPLNSLNDPDSLLESPILDNILKGE